MEFIPKLANIVVLGNFNPGILSVDFLQNICKIPLKDPKKEMLTPVESVVTSANITFIASLDRFEVSEIDLKDFENTKINENVKPYLDTLSHTPLQACGMNLNIDVKSLDLKVLQKYFIEDHFSLAKLLKAEELFIRNDLRVSEKKEEYIQYNANFFIRQPDIKGNIRIKVNPGNTFTFLYNYEIRKKSDFALVIDRYQDRVKEFKNLIQEIG